MAGAYVWPVPLRAAAGKRRLRLQGCFNLRDLGGYRTGEGERTRYRHLFRSDSLHRLTTADQAELARVGLASIIDLRTPEERADQGPARVAATQYLLPMPDVLPHPNGERSWHAEPAAVAAAYLSTLEDSVETIREILAVLTDSSTYPAVVCCPSGVERTGIVTAVVLGLLGVPDATIVGDFAGSREAVLRRIGRLRFEHPSAVSVDLDRYGVGLLGVLPDAMVRFLELVRTEHGTFAGYAQSIDMAGAVPYLRAAALES
jgi:protein-tyrosine phosphatase